MFSGIYRTLLSLNHHRAVFNPELLLNRFSLPRLCGSPAFYRSTLPKFPAQEVLPDQKDILKITKDTITKVNEQIAHGKEGRLFAVVHLCGKQFKVTTEDIIIVEGYWPPKNGDEIKLEKVLLVGGRDFTLVGRPVLPQDLVSVKATIIEKDLSHTKTVFFKKRRKQYMRINFYRSQTTMLRINEILVQGKVNDHKTVTQYERM